MSSKPDAAPSPTWYREFLHRYADKEAHACQVKLAEYGLPDDNVFRQIEALAARFGFDEQSIYTIHGDEQAFWTAWYLSAYRHWLAIDRMVCGPIQASPDALRKRLGDLYGYACLGLARLAYTMVDSVTKEGGADGQ